MSLTETRSRIARAADAHGRDAADISLVAVSKLQPLDRIEAVLGQGHRVFGENRLQEAQEKWPAFRERFPDIELHLVGALQTNKVRAAMALFDAIHVVDRPKLATTIARIAGETGSSPDLFVQVNTGNEPQKAGVAVDDADDLVAGCRALDLPLKGLMCLPPSLKGPHMSVWVPQSSGRGTRRRPQDEPGPGKATSRLDGAGESGQPGTRDAEWGSVTRRQSER